MTNDLISIMIVDDETFYIDEISQFIDCNIFDVVCTATNGKQALSLFQKYRPQIVIADIEMPYMNGLDLCKEIQQINNQTHLILLTAYDDFNYARRGISNAIDEYILKYELNKTILAEKLATIADKIHMSDLQAIKQLHYLAYSIIEDDDSKITLNNSNNKYLIEPYRYILVELDEPLDILSHIQSYTNTNLKEQIKLFVHETPWARFCISLPQNRFLIALYSEKHLKFQANYGHLDIYQCTNLLYDLLNVGTYTCTLYIMSTAHLISDFLYRLNDNPVFQKKRFLGCGKIYSFNAKPHECHSSTFDYNPTKISKFLENSDYDSLQAYLSSLFTSIRESLDIEFFCKTIRFIYYAFESFSQTNELERVFPMPIIYDIDSANEWTLNTSYCLINGNQDSAMKNYSPAVKKAIEYIRLSYSDNQLSTQKIAEHVYLSAGRLRTLFKQETSTTIHKTITQIRITKAKQLLSSTNTTINDIANQVGFGSQQYFSQIFFSHEGTTPMQYRKGNSV